MAFLSLELLGPPHLARAGSPLDLRVRKELALLAYLAVEQRHRHSRDTLLGLLWPDIPEQAARNNLRVALANLRRLLGESGGPFLHADRQHVQFLPTSDHFLDVTAFRELVAACQAHAHASPERCDACLAQLAAAAELYRGDFMAGFSLSDGVPFQEWAAIQREQLRQLMVDTLETLASGHELCGDYAAQCDYSRRQIALDPWREQAHAQLIRGLWATGQRGAALEQYEACRRLLASELGLEPSAELSALAEQLRAATAPPARPPESPAHPPVPQPRRPAALRQHNLPAQTTSFVGREAELRGIQELLAGARLVTLTGAGGSGKTRLALAVAESALPAYADGVWLAELASLQDPALVPQAVATALGVHLLSGQPAGHALSTNLRSKQLLVVLDNCEHLTLACRQLAEQLLRTCPRLTILATSREILRVAGENVWQVPPLAMPAGNVIAPEQLIRYAGIELFIERARAVRAGFTLTERNAPAVVQICQRLDSNPLAIELAAARVRHIDVETIVARLDQRFSLLTAGSHPELRQQALRSTIDWSYALLSEAERACFRRLAVFVGGFTLPLVEEIVCEHDRPGDLAAGAIELLAQLIDKSLIVAEQRGNGMRYRLLETIRAYALEQLRLAGEAETLRNRHLASFIRLAEEAEPHLFSADQVAWLDQLATEHDNLRAAIDWSLERGDAQAALRLVTALRSFWYTRGHYDEGQRRTIQVLAMPGAQAPTIARASALNAAGALLWVNGDAASALALLDEAIAIGREVHDTWNTGWALLHIGTIAYRQGQHAKAQALLEEGLASCRAAGPAGRRGVGWALTFLGDLAVDAGDEQLARARFEESVVLLRELSDYGLLAYPLRRLGHLALQRGDFPAARAFCTESLRLNLEIEDRLAVAACLAAQAGIAAAEGQAAGAERRAERMGHAARLCGAVAAQLEAIGAPLWPADAAAIEQIAADTRARLGEPAFDAAWAAGRTMTIAQLLANEGA